MRLISQKAIIDFTILPGIIQQEPAFKYHIKYGRKRRMKARYNQFY